MPPAIPTAVPDTLTIGNTWQWTTTIPDFTPSDDTGTWTLSYVVAGVGLLEWDASWVTVSGGGWAITVPAASTAGLTAGGYQWTAILTGASGYAGQRWTPLTGRVTLVDNPAALEPGDVQNFAEAQLAAIEEVLAGRWTDDLQAYTIGGRSVTLIPVAELWEIRSRLRSELWRARNPGKALPGMSVAFVRYR